MIISTVQRKFTKTSTTSYTQNCLHFMKSTYSTVSSIFSACFFHSSHPYTLYFLLAQAQEQLDMTKKIYEDFNNQLHTEMPALYDKYVWMYNGWVSAGAKGPLAKLATTTMYLSSANSPQPWCSSGRVLSKPMCTSSSSALPSKSLLCITEILDIHTNTIVFTIISTVN